MHSTDKIEWVSVLFYIWTKVTVTRLNATFYTYPIYLQFWIYSVNVIAGCHCIFHWVCKSVKTRFLTYSSLKLAMHSIQSLFMQFLWIYSQHSTFHFLLHLQLYKMCIKSKNIVLHGVLGMLTHARTCIMHVTENAKSQTQIL